ncbi:MAG: YceI family protein [Saccharofermentanaceae bacterium]|jgi:polyisoprenoid-binding protein YceI|nr:YceI family protein [Bacteroidales bacterium]
METTAKTKWVIDPMHTDIKFKVKHLVISTVTGGFDTFEGSALTDGDNFTNAQVEFSADVNSINTNQADRDKHLKSPDFFDAANHPRLTFRSTSFKNTGGSDYIMTGHLTIRGITKPVELKIDFGGIAKDPYGNIKAGFELTGKINRKEFGLVWNALTEAGGMVVADEVKLQINIELARS